MWCCVGVSRQKHREEVLKLRQELQAIQSTSKGGQQATDRTKKDLEKTRCARPPPSCISSHTVPLFLSFLHTRHVLHGLPLAVLSSHQGQCLQAATLSVTAGPGSKQVAPSSNEGLCGDTNRALYGIKQLCGIAGRS